MERVQSARQQIADYDHGLLWEPEHFSKALGDDLYAAYYTSKFLIGDTAEAISNHMNQGFSDSALTAYVEFWGVMQALFIQQDAIKELYRAIHGMELSIRPNGSAWQTLREKRNILVGHPAKKDKPLRRSFMGRIGITYERIQYEQWNADSGQRTYPIFNLRKLIERYDIEASEVLTEVLATMQRR